MQITSRRLCHSC